MINAFAGAALDLRSSSLRTFAAIAGMVAAVLAVILVDAATVLSHDANQQYVARRYGRAVTMSISAQGVSNTLDDESHLIDVLQTNGFTLLSTDFSASVPVVSDGIMVFPAIRVISPQFNQIRVTDLVAGTWPELTARSATLHAVVVSGWANDNLRLTDREIVGRTLGYALVTAGVFDPQTSPVVPIIVDAVVSASSAAFANEGKPPVAVVSENPPEQLVLATPNREWVLRVAPEDEGLVKALVQSITSPDSTTIFDIRRTDLGDELAPLLDQQSVTARATAAIALLVGGLGILGVGIASVRERAKEYGVLRALGASRSAVFLRVILRTTMESVLAAVIAIPAAAVAVQLVGRNLVLSTLPLPSSLGLPVQSALIGLMSATLVGLVAGTLPAIHASRLSVSNSLRGQ